MFTLFRTKSKIKIHYKSGNVHEQWFIDFAITKRNGKIISAEWTVVDGYRKILELGIDQIEAVYQTGAKINVFTCMRTWLKQLVS